MDHHLLFFVLAIVCGITAGWLFGRQRVKRHLRTQNVEGSLTAAPPTVKCHGKTFVYADGSEVTVHSFCDGHDYEAITDAYGQSLKPEVPLLEVRGHTHRVR